MQVVKSRPETPLEDHRLDLEVLHESTFLAFLKEWVITTSFAYRLDEIPAHQQGIIAAHAVEIKDPRLGKVDLL